MRETTDPVQENAEKEDDDRDESKDVTLADAISNFEKVRRANSAGPGAPTHDFASLPTPARAQPQSKTRAKSKATKPTTKLVPLVPTVACNFTNCPEHVLETEVHEDGRVHQTSSKTVVLHDVAIFLLNTIRSSESIIPVGCNVRMDLDLVEICWCYCFEIGLNLTVTIPGVVVACAKPDTFKTGAELMRMLANDPDAAKRQDENELLELEKQEGLDRLNSKPMELENKTPEQEEAVVTGAEVKQEPAPKKKATEKIFKKYRTLRPFIEKLLTSHHKTMVTRWKKEQGKLSKGEEEEDDEDDDDDDDQGGDEGTANDGSSFIDKDQKFMNKIMAFVVDNPPGTLDKMAKTHSAFNFCKAKLNKDMLAEPQKFSTGDPFSQVIL